jgi:hypothetical protein
MARKEHPFAAAAAKNLKLKHQVACGLLSRPKV